MHTIAELPQYIKRAERLLSERQRQEVIDFLAENPDSGVLIRGTGGIRKLRWGREGMGKSGGVRVIYYYHNEAIPLYLLTVFGKGEKSTLSKAEEHELTALAKVLLEHGRQQR